MEAQAYIGLYTSGIHDMRFLRDKKHKYLVIDNTAKRAQWFRRQEDAYNLWQIWRHEIVIDSANIGSARSMLLAKQRV